MISFDREERENGISNLLKVKHSMKKEISFEREERER